MKKILCFLALALTSTSRASDEWIPFYRMAYTVDAFQTYDAIRSPNKYESNPLFCKMSAEEAFVSVLAVNWAQERLVTWIKDKNLRAIAGWLLVFLESDVCLGNARAGLRINFTKKF